MSRAKFYWPGQYFEHCFTDLASVLITVLLTWPVSWALFNYSGQCLEHCFIVLASLERFHWPGKTWTLFYRPGQSVFWALFHWPSQCHEHCFTDLTRVLSSALLAWPESWALFYWPGQCFTNCLIYLGTLSAFFFFNYWPDQNLEQRFIDLASALNTVSLTWPVSWTLFHWPGQCLEHCFTDLASVLSKVLLTWPVSWALFHWPGQCLEHCSVGASATGHQSSAVEIYQDGGHLADLRRLVHRHRHADWDIAESRNHYSLNHDNVTFFFF